MVSPSLFLSLAIYIASSCKPRGVTSAPHDNSVFSLKQRNLTTVAPHLVIPNSRLSHEWRTLLQAARAASRRPRTSTVALVKSKRHANLQRSYLIEFAGFSEG